MSRDCITDSQGRAPCTCGQLHTSNSDGSSPDNPPWDWIDEVANALRWVALGVVGVTTVLLMAGFFAH